MSVMSAMEDVNTSVTTLMEAITALVMMDICFKMRPTALVGIVVWMCNGKSSIGQIMKKCNLRMWALCVTG